MTKPLDRGITGYVLSDETGMNLTDAPQSSQWSTELDETIDGVTKSYLAWPIWELSGQCIGVIEFRNKKGTNNAVFDVADTQFAQIIAFQISRAVVEIRKQTLLDGRNHAINIAYEKNFDESDSVAIESEAVTEPRYSARASINSKMILRKALLLQRSARVLTPSWKWKNSNYADLSERGWGFDVFLQGGEELIMHAVDIFDERGLFSNFSIPVSTFVNFAKEIKAGYNDNAPYHNYHHAFDVMHVCYLFITRCKAEEYLDSFNVLSILVAALAHDLGHDGFNNAFHAATNSELSIIYNGVSILENYSAAYLFRILRKQECNIFARFSDADMNKMRTRMIDLILDTDAKNHFTLMTRFKHSMEMKQVSRGLLSSMILHVSDVSNPTRPGPISRKWAFTVQEEFFRQGDKEKEFGLPMSPFMDREFENLPRMQGAFIDALVQPVFKLLAELLPLIDSYCLTTLQSNRAFWNTMQNQGIMTTADIVAYLKGIQEPKMEYSNEESDNTINSDILEQPIPGIPDNATKAPVQSPRKLSMISMRDKISNLEDPELGEIIQQPEFEELAPPSPNKKIICFKKVESTLRRYLEHNISQTILLSATIYALFANDINVAIGSKEADGIVDTFSLFVLTIFIIEMIVSIICVPKYFHFFLWLDLAASVSLFLEIGLLFSQGDSPGELSLAKASRAAKAGARAGRLAKLFRLVRLIKVAKLLKWTMRSGKPYEEKDMEADDEIDIKMSVVGRTMTERITKKVIIAVMLMLAIFSLLEADFVPDGRQLQLDALALHPDSELLREGFFDAHPNLLRLSGAGPDFLNIDRIEQLRDIEVLSLQATSDESVIASFDLADEMAITAWFSLCTTLSVTMLLAVLSCLFSRDAFKIMIRPIEKMKSTVQMLSQNPLLHLEKMKKQAEEKAGESNETDLLEHAINKMATLLQVGFGCAGADIIAKSFSNDGELDPMVPGIRVHAIFGFCDIRDFTAATEYLQQDVMLFVNKIAHITHKHCVDSGGAPNKNIGDAFLLVWKLNSTKEGNRRTLQKSLFDDALFCVQQIISDIKQIDSLAQIMQKDGEENKEYHNKIYDFKVAMGFGLHTGWAIEGSIGSKVKVDASYLSSHVNLASRLEAATKQYHVPLLMSEEFVFGLSGSIQSTCRRVDRVTFKGSTEPMTMYYQDTEPFITLNEKPSDYDEMMTSTSWKDKDEIHRLGLDLTVTLKALKSDKNLLIRDVYDAAFNAYLDGEWGKCKVLFHLWLEKFPGDTIIQLIVRYLMSHNFECPESWSGFHVLNSK